VPTLEDLISDLTSGDDCRAEMAIPLLAQMGQEVLTTLLRLLDNPDPDIRWWAVRALAQFKQNSAGQGLLRALSDPDPSVRYCAALSLRLSPFPPAIPTLITLLEGTDRLLARLAGDTLTTHGKEAIPALSEALTSSDPAVRGETSRSLAKMEIQDALPALFSASEDPSPIVQYWIEEGFERLGVGMVLFKP
jgi:HEAT repeat protein